MAKKTISTPEVNKLPNLSDFYKIDPDSVEMKALLRVYNRYYAMKGSQDRRLMERMWDKATKQWEALMEEKGPDDWQSNHYVPLTHSIVESIIAEIIDESPEPLILPRGEEDAPQAQIMTHILDYTDDISDFDLIREELLRDCFIQGTAIAQEYFFIDNRRIKTGPDGKSKVEYKEEVKPDYQDVYTEPVRLKDFYVDEFAREMHRGPYRARDCIRRYVMNIDDFRLFFSGDEWDPLKSAQYVKPGGSVQFDSYFEFFKPPEGIDISNQVEVLWYWSVKPDDWLIIVANSVLILMGPNPYKHKQLPFIRLVDVKRPHRFYGKGEASILESIQDELNIIRRMIIDRNHLDIDKMFIGSSRLMLSDEDTIARPHGFIPTDDPDALKPIEYGDIPRSVELSLGFLKNDATIATGVNPEEEALPSVLTATQAAIMKETRLKRIRLKISRYNLEFLTQRSRLRVSNILQYYPEYKMEKIIGEAETQQFEDEMSDLENKGWVRSFDMKDFSLSSPNKNKYKKIRLSGKELNFDEQGKATIKASPTPFSFFELKPEYYFPNQGGFDIKYGAGSDIPISKPLMQSKAAEMYDRLIQLAVGGIGGAKGFDPIKLADNLIKVNDDNPENYKLDPPGEDLSNQLLQNAIQLAEIEDSMIMRGKDVPSTAYAPMMHTQIHIKFTGTAQFQSLSSKDKRVDVMLAHIAGELMAQSQRGTGVSTIGSNMPPQQPTPQQGGAAIASPTSPSGTPASLPQTPQSSSSNSMGNIMPSQISGGQMQQSLHPGI